MEELVHEAAMASASALEAESESAQDRSDADVQDLVSGALGIASTDPVPLV